MELATGKVRYEFSGPGALGWYAAFTPRGDAFLASKIFSQEVQIWPTAHEAAAGRSAPKPRGTVSTPKGMPMSVQVSSRDQVAISLADGRVVLRAFEGTAPTLASLPGKGVPTLAFSRDGSLLAGIRGGALHVWTLAREPVTSSRD